MKLFFRAGETLFDAVRCFGRSRGSLPSLTEIPGAPPILPAVDWIEALFPPERACPPVLPSSAKCERRRVGLAFGACEAKGNKNDIPTLLLNTETRHQEVAMNQIVYLVGLVVVVIAVLSYFGLR
jgi:hypothetical protein